MPTARPPVTTKTPLPTYRPPGTTLRPYIVDHTESSNTIVTTTIYPIMNIINKISLKFANTAEFIAGMLRGVAPQVSFH